MTRRLTARPRGALRTVLAMSVVLLVGATTAGPSAAAARAPERAAPGAAASADVARWAGPLPDTNYPVPADATHVAVACTIQPQPPCGDDSNPGTADRPVATLRKAIERVQAGKTIVMHEGEYREDAGVAMKQVTIQPYPHATVWLKGSIVQTSWTKDATKDEWKANGWTSPFCLSGGARQPVPVCYDPAAVDTGSAAGLPEQVFVDGVELAQVLDGVGVAGQSKFRIDTATRELVIGVDPTGKDVEISQHSRAIMVERHWDPGLPGGNNSKILGIGVTHYATHWRSETQQGAVVMNATNVTFEGNTVVENSGTGVAVMQNPSVVRNNNVSMNGYRGMVVHQASGTVLERNTFDGNNTQHYKINGCGDFCTVAAVKATEASDLKVSYNRFTNTHGAGFWCDVACLDADIVANTASDNIGAGIFYEISAGGFIAFNRIENTRGHSASDEFSAGVKVANSQNVEIIANTFSNNHRQLALFDGNRDADCPAGLTCRTTGTVVVENTFLHDQPGDRRLLTTMAYAVYADEMFDDVGDIARNRVQRPADQDFHWVTRRRHWIYRSLAEFEDTGVDGAKIDGQPIDFGSEYVP